MRKSIPVAVLAIAACLGWAPVAGACPGADVPAGGDSPGQASQAMACLLNQVRRSHHLHRLRGNVPLETAALEHSDAMDAQDFFAHDGDGTPLSRAAGAGFRGSIIGETLAYGTFAFGSPSGMVAAWMQSPEHRQILLMHRWRKVGVGVSLGSPLGPDGPGQATYTADFGAR